MSLNIYYDKDADLALIQRKKVAIIGYGSQGHAHANNLKDSGVEVCVGLREGSSSWAKATEAGLTVKPVAEAVASSDVIMILAPDETQGDLYRDDIEPNLKDGATLAFAHGFNIHFDQIKPRADLDVIMIAPKGPGHLVRSTYQQGGGVPSLIAIEQIASGQATDVALVWRADGIVRRGYRADSSRF
jgi:ketol-acid reductoisomerase